MRTDQSHVFVGMTLPLPFPSSPQPRKPLLPPRWRLFDSVKHAWLLQTLIPDQIWVLKWKTVSTRLHRCVIWSGYSVWDGWQTESRHRGRQGLQTDLWVQGWYLLGLDSTWPFRNQRFIYRTKSLCVCTRVYLPVCARVSYVFARSPRGEYVLSALRCIHQGWHFLPFPVQSKHTATCAISALRDVERPDLCDLSVRNYPIVTLTHWFGTLPFYYFSCDR